jgi:putative salt-induced outer membrane protein YdiY
MVRVRIGSVRRRALLFLCAAFILGSATVRADDLVLHNGDRLSGRVTSVSKSGLELETALAGHVTVKWHAIVSLTGSTKVRIAQTGGRVLDGTLAVVHSRVKIQQDGQPPIAVDVDALSTFELATGRWGSARWHSTLNAGIDVTRGNSTTATISISGTSTRLGLRDKVGMFGTYLFSSTGSGADQLTTARTTRGGLRYDHDVAGATFAFGFGDVENDPYQLLDLRTVGGAGAGLHAMKNDATQLNFVAGLSYARDRYIAETAADSSGGTVTTSPGQSGNAPGKSGSAPGQQDRTGTPPNVVRTSLTRSVAEYLVGQDLMHQLSDNINATEGLTFYAATNDWHDYRIALDLTLSAQINGWLQWNLTLADRYLNIPPAGGAVQNDIFLTTGFGVVFGRGDAGSYTGADRRPAPKR